MEDVNLPDAEGLLVGYIVVCVSISYELENWVGTTIKVRKGSKQTHLGW